MKRTRLLRNTPLRPAAALPLLALSLLSAVVGCGGNVSVVQKTPAVTIAPVITAFTGASSNINIGQSTQLTWSAFQATSVTLNGGTAQVTSPVTVTPTTTTTYTLTATNAIGTTTATTTVSVLQLPIINNFSAAASSVPAGTGTTLNWSATGEASYTLATTVNGVTTTAAEAATITSVNVTPAATSTYVLTATNAAGSVTATTTVTVTPLIKTFTATPSSVTAGQPVTLAWTASGATSYAISGVNGAVTSQVIVYPSVTGSYTLTASNSSGGSTAAAPVTVTTATALNSAGTVTTGSPGVAVSRTFMGLSIGSTSYQAILGTPATGTNKIYRKLLGNLTAYGAGPINMRIGGNSAETQGIPTVTTVSSLAQLATDTGAQFILGLSLQPENASLTISQAQAFNTTMPAGSILGFEVGNEPDLYVQNGYRASPYNYVSDFDTFRTDLANAGVTNKVVGPAWSNSPSLSGLPAFLTAQKPYLSVVTQHAYGGNICPTGSGTTLAGDYLLQETAQNNEAAVSLSTGGTASVNLVHAAGLPYRIGETNTINCSGQLGVSNTFQAALWSMDWMSRLAAAGVDGVNFFGNNDNNYSIFQFTSATGTNGNVTYSISTGSIRPQYYGLVMFQQATQNTAKFLPVSVTTTANLKTYAWLDASGNIRVLVLNKDEAAAGVFSVTVTGYGAARLTRLTAPSYTSTSGVLYNGQTLDSSTDGTFQGVAYGEIVTPASGVYSFAMPITSAALLDIPHN
jgi:hypothetical protein